LSGPNLNWAPYRTFTLNTPLDGAHLVRLKQYSSRLLKASPDKYHSIYKELCREPTIRPNQYTFNIMIHGCMKKGKTVEAEHWQTEMKRQEVKPNVVIYTSLLSGFARNQQPKSVEKVFNEIEESNSMEAEYHQLVLHEYIDTGQHRDAIEFLVKMVKDGITPHDQAIFRLIEDYMKVDFTLDVKVVHQRMIDAGIPMSIDIWSIFIKYYQEGGELEKADELQHLMIQQGIKSNFMIYMNQIKRDNLRGLHDKVLSTIIAIRQERIPMVVDSNMRQKNDTMQIINLMIRTLCKVESYEMYEMAKGIHEEMIAIGLKPDRRTYTHFKRDYGIP